MKKFLLISSILLGGVVASKGIPTLGGPTLSGAPTSGGGTNIVITTNGIDGATSSTIAQTNIAGKVPNMLNSGTNRYAGDGGGLTNILANKLTKHIAAFYTTNQIENRAYLYVTGNVAAVNGAYKVSWYNPERFIGIWTNTASTNMILMNNPSNSAGIANQPFIIAANSNPTSFLYQEDQDWLGVRDTWINPFVASGSAFSGTAGILGWGTNYERQLVVTSFDVGGTNVGIVATNLIRVSLEGSDELASRLNYYPFKTLYAAQTNATTYDLIYVEPGHHKTKPFHMSNRNFHILGAGEGICIIEPINYQTGPDPFQSRALIPWDNCSIGGFTITNGLIALAQFSGVVLGGTNVWVHDVTVYPPSSLRYPDNTLSNTSNGDQSVYCNVGVAISRIGNDCRIERVKVYSGMRGFAFRGTYSTSGAITMVNCEAYCSPEYVGGSPNIWTNAIWLGANTNVGGMLPIAFEEQFFPLTVGTATLNVIGGKFISMNGGTNIASYVGGENQTSRNAGIWISRAYTNTVTINWSGIPQFYLGNTNSITYAILNEATNNNVTINGYAPSNYVAQASNTLYQAVYASGTPATSSGSLVTMNFGTTDPVLKVTSSGIYAIFTAASGITASADDGSPVTINVASNNITIPNSAGNLTAIDAGLTGMLMPWALTTPIVYTPLVAGDTVALQWQSVGTAWAADNASISILRVK